MRFTTPYKNLIIDDKHLPL